MGLYRTYFDKDNTIIKNEYTNTGLNPVLRLVYGGVTNTYSRVIFTFNVDDITAKINDNIIANNVKHTLNLTNTVAYDRTVLNQITEFNQDHASSFDLVLFKVPELWDEGTGYDYDFETPVLDINGKIYASPSNYYERSGLLTWAEPGIYSGSTSNRYEEVTRIHFDLGNENIKTDITSLIEILIASGTTNFFGLGLAFSNDLENSDTEILYSVDFYGKDTHTFFEPFIETTWDENILDDRNNFYFDKANKLYLYTNINKEPVNLDQLPSAVTILDYNDETVATITEINHESKGVYSVNLDLSFNEYGVSLVNFSDIWSGLIIGGRSLPDAEMEFTVHQNDYFNIGNDLYEPQEFTFSFTGIKRAEKINKGEIRKIIVTVKEYFNNDSLILDNIYYRIYVKQGNSKIEVIPETKINRAFNQNYFYLDTAWMITQDYFMDIIVHSNGTTMVKDNIYFTILDGATDNN